MGSRLDFEIYPQPDGTARVGRPVCRRSTTTTVTGFPSSGSSKRCRSSRTVTRERCCSASMRCGGTTGPLRACAAPKGCGVPDGVTSGLIGPRSSASSCYSSAAEVALTLSSPIRWFWWSGGSGARNGVVRARGGLGAREKLAALRSGVADEGDLVWLPSSGVLWATALLRRASGRSPGHSPRAPCEGRVRAAARGRGGRGRRRSCARRQGPRWSRARASSSRSRDTEARRCRRRVAGAPPCASGENGLGRARRRAVARGSIRWSADRGVRASGDRERAHDTRSRPWGRAHAASTSGRSCA